jgi:hypothetical protein
MTKTTCQLHPAAGKRWCRARSGWDRASDWATAVLDGEARGRCCPGAGLGCRGGGRAPGQGLLQQAQGRWRTKRPAEAGARAGGSFSLGGEHRSGR